VTRKTHRQARRGTRPSSCVSLAASRIVCFVGGQQRLKQKRYAGAYFLKTPVRDCQRRGGTGGEEPGSNISRLWGEKWCKSTRHSAQKLVTHCVLTSRTKPLADFLRHVQFLAWGRRFNDTTDTHGILRSLQLSVA
jgi:hypothetical protein